MTYEYELAIQNELFDGGADEKESDLTGVLRKINTLLCSNDVQANELFQNNESRIIRTFEAEGKKLGELISAFDYSEASELIDRILVETKHSGK